MNRTFIGAVAIGGLLLSAGGTALLHAQQSQPFGTKSVNSLKASTIGLMRSLNTAEYVYQSEHGYFASLDDLYDTNYIHHTAPRVHYLAADGTDIIPDLKATVVLAPEKGSYALAVYDKAKDDQGFTAFSDTSGVIYQGQPIEGDDPLHRADINLVRTINTAEITYQHKYGHFADFETLNAEGSIQSYGGAPTTFAKSPLVLPNLEVTIALPAAQDTWLIALHNKSQQPGPFSAYSDPTGIIYEAEPLK